jgi:hypothetical protein
MTAKNEQRRRQRRYNSSEGDLGVVAGEEEEEGEEGDGDERQGGVEEGAAELGALAVAPAFGVGAGGEADLGGVLEVVG